MVEKKFVIIVEDIKNLNLNDFLTAYMHMRNSDWIDMQKNEFLNRFKEFEKVKKECKDNGEIIEDYDYSGYLDWKKEFELLQSCKSKIIATLEDTEKLWQEFTKDCNDDDMIYLLKC
jgi:hypothetical protein